MKATLAILFSALLALAQSALPGDGLSVKAQALCSHCDCGKSNCCVGDSAPTSNSQPASPATPLSLKRAPQLALALAMPILAPPLSPAAKGVSSYLSSARSEALPLYEWNCARLI